MSQHIMVRVLQYYQKCWIDGFTPFWFIMCMGTGISANILYKFPYKGQWMIRCSYIFFAIACILFISLQLISWIQFLQNAFSGPKRKLYYWRCFRNMNNNVFWGTYAMGLQTIINYIFVIATSNSVKDTEHAKRLMHMVFVLWWYDISISFIIAWGITFIIWKDHNHYFEETEDYESVPEIKTMRENLQTVLLLPVITLVVACSCSGIFAMSDLFTQCYNRNVQLLTLTITFLAWLHVIVLVAFIMVIYVWNLYVNKLPQENKVFSLFLCLGPMGQGAFGILWLTKDVKIYIDMYYKIDPNVDLNGYIAKVAVGCCFQIFGLLASLTLLGTGFFFTFLAILRIITCFKGKTELYKYQKAWWSMTFPLGTMAIGSLEFYIQFDPLVPMSAFRVISTIYSGACIIVTLACLTGTIIMAANEFYEFISEADLSSLPTTNSHNKPNSESPSFSFP